MNLIYWALDVLSDFFYDLKVMFVDAFMFLCCRRGKKTESKDDLSSMEDAGESDRGDT